MDMNTVTGRSIWLFLDSDVTDLSEIRNNVLRDIRNSRFSRRETYMDIIPDGSLHYVYKAKHTINETHRTSYTKFRVSGHALAYESGRWNRRGRGRLPLKECLCQCGAVQTERHVLQDCPLTRHIRDTYEFTNLDELFSEAFEPNVTCQIIHNILSICEQNWRPPVFVLLYYLERIIFVKEYGLQTYDGSGH